ncbi:carboxymethylenebutenolidase homolog [Cynara cardunculus var. scolymus]|uniref:Carboxymethylenebutenolidase homolog n=1 Tax=Cynara cardunculus var. scolymus TaxID=59895 RepID=A0A103XWP1_CYNCS|nr:carboxymethylenebutenolidase homolog [Cynara cardunculus var. scolymus]KVH98250.1 Dienelactone hydrolase [Cynara cardunculus var. scolymus]
MRYDHEAQNFRTEICYDHDHSSANIFHHPPHSTIHAIQTAHQEPEMGLTSAIFTASAATSSRFLVRSPLPSFSPHLSISKICNLSLNRRRRSSSLRKHTGRRLVSCSQVQIQDGTDEEEACELVNGIEVSIGEGSDTVPAYLLTAVKNNNGTGILLLSDVFGFEDSSTRDFAYRIACNGYNVLLPDLFNGDPWRKENPKASLEPWLATHSQTASKSIATSRKWMVDEFVAAGISKKLGIIGFCFGGGKVVEVLADDHDGYFGLGVSFYGTRIEPSVAANVKVPILFITGDNDPLCPVKVVEDIERHNVGGSKVVVFKGRGNGFVHRPASAEDDKDAEAAFMIMRNWLHNGLVVEKK